MSKRSPICITTLLVLAIVAGASPWLRARGPQETAVGPLTVTYRNGSAETTVTGTGLMMGRVVDGSTGQPIEGAAVTANLSAPMSQAARGGPPPRYTSPQLVTGPDGYFVIRNVPAGDFTLTASLRGYLSSSGDDVTRPGGQGRPVTVGAGEKVNTVVLRLWRTGAVTGQANDEQGEGLEGITMSLVKIERIGERRKFTIQTTATTDDRGVYRFTSVAPGDYSVCALFTRRIAPLPVNAVPGPNAADAQRYMSGSGAGSTSGSGYRVDDLVLISAMSSRNVDPGLDSSGRFFVFGDACYPAAPLVPLALPITVESGQEKSGITVTLRQMPTVKVRGTVTGPAGSIPGIAVHLYAAASDDAIVDGAIEAASTVTDAAGAFGFIGVPSGQYVLRVNYIPPYGESRAVVAQASSDLALWASQPIEVQDGDVTGVALTLREGAKVSGRVAIDGSATRVTVDRNSLVSLSFEAAGALMMPAYARSPMQANPDGTFQAVGFVPGSYLVRPMVFVPGWSVKSIVANGRDISADPLDISGADVTGIVVTLTDHPNELTGVVRDANGAADGAARVIVFPADRSRWNEYGLASRQQTSARATRTGTYLFTSLPAGDYFVVAVDDRLGLSAADPKTLANLASSATRVTIGDGQRSTIDLRTTAYRAGR